MKDATQNWILIQPKDIYHYLAASQLDAVRARELTENQGDPLVEVIVDVSMLVRLIISASARNPRCNNLALLPRELKSSACHLVIESLQSRIPTLRLSPDQVRNANNARKLLMQIAKGEIPLSSPYSNSCSIKSHKSRSSQLKGETMKGLW